MWLPCCSCCFTNSALPWGQRRKEGGVFTITHLPQGKTAPPPVLAATPATDTHGGGGARPPRGLRGSAPPCAARQHDRARPAGAVLKPHGRPQSNLTPAHGSPPLRAPVSSRCPPPRRFPRSHRSGIGLHRMLSSIPSAGSPKGDPPCSHGRFSPPIAPALPRRSPTFPSRLSTGSPRARPLPESSSLACTRKAPPPSPPSQT